MRYCNLIAPFVVFVAGIILSATAWCLMSEEVALAAGISANAHSDVIIFAGLASLIGFGVGALFGLAIRSQGILSQDYSPALLVAWMKGLTFVSAICLAFILALTAIEGGGLSVFLDTMSGRRRFAAIEGVTTFVHLSTAAAVLIFTGVVCSGWRSIAASGRNVMGWFVLLLMLILIRAFVGGERVAIYYPVIAGVAVIMVRSHSQVSLKALAGAIVICLVVTGFFVAGEYLRSYGVKRSDYGLDEGLWSYGLNRLLVYYGASVNTGGALLEVVRDGHGHEELFRHTFNPGWKILSLTSGREEAGGMLAEMIEWSGLYNPEFNNAWGVATPFTEGPWIGLLYWALWGFVATRCWVSAKRQGADAATLSIFGLVTAGLIEAARVNALGTVHLLVPLAMLVLVRRSMRVAPATVFSNTTLSTNNIPSADPR